MQPDGLALKAGKGDAVKRVAALVAVALSVLAAPAWARAGGWLDSKMMHGWISNTDLFHFMMRSFG